MAEKFLRPWNGFRDYVMPNKSEHNNWRLIGYGIDNHWEDLDEAI